MRILTLIGEGVRALRSLITTKESAMTDTSIINSNAQTSDAALPQFAVPDSNVPTDPRLQRLTSPSTVAPATSEETPGETDAAPDAAAKQSPAQPAEAATETDAQPQAPVSVADAAAGQASAQAVGDAAQPPASADDASATPVAQASAQPADDASATPVAQAPAQPTDNASATPVAQASAQPAVDAVQSDLSAGVKDFSAAFVFVQQGIEHLGAAARDELFTLARKYL